jgi:type I site-specific restriction endonuclease
MLEWGEDEIPDSVDAAEINKRLFNEDTVDLVLEHLMQNGIKVEGGDRIGKTIIFAKNQSHAKFIEQRFNAAYPALAGHFARVITYETGPYAQTLIDDFSKKNSVPHIAISVDMLDTGIDVPEVVNLVFFKQVRSKTKFWQMMGRGTRLCPDLFGPGQDKEFFRVFDYCQNLEFFGANPALKEASAAKSLSEGVTVPLLELVRLRLRDLVQHIDKSKKAIVYSNFADEIGEGVEHELPQFGEADFARFKLKARHFLKSHEDHIVLHKLRQGKPLTPTDLNELEKMLLDAGIGEAGDIERARETSQGFGRFVRSIVGLDRAAVSEAFSEFLAAGATTSQQIEFINMVIEHLTDQGAMDPALLYEPPFTDLAPTGPEKLFDEEKVARLVTRIRAINDSAVA